MRRCLEVTLVHLSVVVEDLEDDGNVDADVVDCDMDSLEAFERRWALRKVLFSTMLLAFATGFGNQVVD